MGRAKTGQVFPATYPPRLLSPLGWFCQSGWLTCDQNAISERFTLYYVTSREVPVPPTTHLVRSARQCWQVRPNWLTTVQTLQGFGFLFQDPHLDFEGRIPLILSYWDQGPLSSKVAGFDLISTQTYLYFCPDNFFFLLLLPICSIFFVLHT